MAWPAVSWCHDFLLTFFVCFVKFVNHGLLFTFFLSCFHSWFPLRPWHVIISTKLPGSLCGASKHLSSLNCISLFFVKVKNWKWKTDFNKDLRDVKRIQWLTFDFFLWISLSMHASSSPLPTIRKRSIWHGNWKKETPTKTKVSGKKTYYTCQNRT